MNKINYTGSSKILQRICSVINELIDGGVSSSGPLFYDETGAICIDYDALEVKEDDAD